MKLKLNDIDIRLLERIANITGCETGIEPDGYIDVDILLATMDELEDSYRTLEENYDNYREFVKDNYKQKSLAESYM